MMILTAHHHFTQGQDCNLPNETAPGFWMPYLYETKSSFSIIRAMCRLGLHADLHR